MGFVYDIKATPTFPPEDFNFCGNSTFLLLSAKEIFYIFFQRMFEFLLSLIALL